MEKKDFRREMYEDEDVDVACSSARLGSVTRRFKPLGRALLRTKTIEREFKFLTKEQ